MNTWIEWSRTSIEWTPDGHVLTVLFEAPVNERSVHAIGDEVGRLVGRLKAEAVEVGPQGIKITTYRPDAVKPAELRDALDAAIGNALDQVERDLRAERGLHAWLKQVQELR